ncbi:hypothetical protein RhiirA5_426067 [Rhizophagus irregularis]|uniref:Uncharacterized protein n=1 Tax=Rhizophagus irregularis TaxID=588596 RepID=A0A2N0P523_9GLOM|nr:hypothetical protein RhiirA5_426067 [Rhizophagus irregularis]
MKNLSTSDIKMGSVFLIDSPLNIEFNCRIEDNPLSNKTELIVIALGLMIKAHGNNENNKKVNKLAKLGIKDAQFIDEFLGLNRNEIYKQPELLELIDWKISLKLNCIDQHNTLFENHFLQSFRIKIYCNELLTCVNLKKWKLNIYDEKETIEHLWRCDKIQEVVQYIIKGFKLFLVNIIFEISKKDLDRHQIEVSHQLEIKYNNRYKGAEKNVKTNN